MKNLRLYSYLLVMLSSQCLLAWGAEGHQLVAAIAKTLLKPAIRDSVEFYLQETSFEKASVWMDEVRSDAKYDYLKPMHYINIEKDHTYVKVDGPNIMNELEAGISQLKKRKGSSKAEIKMVLQIVFHLMGDLHQPLHVGYGIDKGGNTIQVVYRNKSINLHKVWDSAIIENENIQLSDCLQELSRVSQTEKNQYQKIDLVQWMEDSRALLGSVYNFHNNQLDELYSDKNGKLIKTQLVKAGIRLAAVLEDCFKK